MFAVNYGTSMEGWREGGTLLWECASFPHHSWNEHKHSESLMSLCLFEIQPNTP